MENKNSIDKKPLQFTFTIMVSYQEWETPPSEEIFQEIKDKAITIWETYDNTHGYVTEKVEYIQSLKNI